MKAAAAKIAVIVGLAIALFVPVVMIQNLVAERQQRRDEAVNGIAEGWGKRQTLAGPYVALPYERTWTQVTQEVVDGKARERRIERTESQVVHVPAENVTWIVSAEIGEKARGIYKARLFSAKLQAQGTIRVPASASLEDGKSRYKWGTPRLVVGISDPHGIRAADGASVGNKRYDLVPGTGEIALSGYADACVLLFPRARRVGNVRHRPAWRGHFGIHARRLAAPVLPGPLPAGAACDRA